MVEDLPAYVQSNLLEAEENIMRYNVVAVSEQKDGPIAEQQMDGHLDLLEHTSL